MAKCVTPQRLPFLGFAQFSTTVRKKEEWSDGDGFSN